MSNEAVESSKCASLLAINPLSGYGAWVRRKFRPLVYLLVAMQLLLSAPMASALTKQALTQAAAIADTSAHGDHEADDCPCCPDNVTTSLDCLAACAPVGAFPASVFLLSIHSTVPLAVAPTPVIYTPLADPPLKPPPIA